MTFVTAHFANDGFSCWASIFAIFSKLPIQVIHTYTYWIDTQSKYRQKQH